jgi:hypothetical protein
MSPVVLNIPCKVCGYPVADPLHEGKLLTHVHGPNQPVWVFEELCTQCASWARRYRSGRTR